ncbi:MAG: hypothetical protein Q7S48_01125 [bacterium]|nr:hypothetical protein [bacterium]
MDEALSYTFVAYHRIDEAIEVAARIRDWGNRASAWLHICEHTHDREHIDRLRKMREAAPPVVKLKVANCVALASHDPADLIHAETLADELARTTEPQASGAYRFTHVALRLEMGEVEYARRLADSLQHIPQRVKARAKIAEHTKDSHDLQALLRDLTENPAQSFKSLRQIAVACLSCGKDEQVRLIARTRLDPGEQCMLFALVAMVQGGTEADLQKAEMAHRSMRKRTGHDSGARQQLVHALNRVGRHRDARLVAMRISAPRLRAYTYLTIHRSEVGGDPLPYETEKW